MATPTVPAQALRALLHRLPPEGRTQLTRRLRAGLASKTSGSQWFVRHGSADPQMRLFCISHAGGGASVFRSWADNLPDGIEVCAIQLPGHESRAGESAHRQVGPVIAELRTAIEPLLDRPFALFGHSMGALLAFELTRELRRRNMPQPEHLLLAAFRAPQLPSPNTRIHHQPDEILKAVLATDGTPRSVLDNEEIMGQLLPTLRADFELCDTYQYSDEEPLSIPLSVFGGLDDVRVGQADLEHWNAQARNDYSLTMLPGGHFFLRSSQDQLLAHLAANLQPALTTTGAQHDF